MRDRLGEIDVPTLVLVGEHDEETPLSYAEALAAGIPGARLQIIPGAGHISNLEAPEAVNIALREHLDAQGRDGMTEWRWIEVFARQLRACALSHGEVVAVLSESASRPELVETSRIAAQMLGGRVYDVVVPTPREHGARWPCARRAPRSALARQPRAPSPAWRRPSLVIDCTVEGLLHAPELGEILARRRARADDQQRAPRELRALRRRPDARGSASRAASRCSRRPREMRVTSAAGTDLTGAARGRVPRGVIGRRHASPARSRTGRAACAWRSRPRTASRASSCSRPATSTSRSRPTSASAVRLRIEDDHVVAIEGDGLDAELFRSYLAAFGDRESYAVSHVGFGMNRTARWDYLELYDKAQINGTEARAFAGNFLFSTGANENAGRYTAGHFDLPMRGCTVALDGRVVVDAGVLQGDLA